MTLSYEFPTRLLILNRSLHKDNLRDCDQPLSLHPFANNQFLRCYLLKLGYVCPRFCSPASLTQKRLLSGVGASSASTTFSPSIPNSNFVSARMIPASSIRFGFYVVDFKAEFFRFSSQPSRRLFFCHVSHPYPRSQPWCLESTVGVGNFGLYVQAQLEEASR